MLEALLEEEAAAIGRKVIDLAKEGDRVALRLCMERLLPVKRERVITIDLQPINSAADAKKAMAAIIASAARGELSPSEASQFSEMIHAYIRAAEGTDLEKRLEALERTHGSKK